MKKIPEPIILDFESSFGHALESEHHSLNENIVENVIQGLGTGADFHYVGDTEGEIFFMAGMVPLGGEATSLISGADGTTNYMKVRATFTSLYEQTIPQVILYGTKSNRTIYKEFSTEDVNIPLVEDQPLTVNWILYAEI